eukprot:2431562-Amphidinium_carterae.1
MRVRYHWWTASTGFHHFVSAFNTEIVSVVMGVGGAVDKNRLGDMCVCGCPLSCSAPSVVSLHQQIGSDNLRKS